MATTRIKFAPGQRVRYKAGKGISTATIDSMEGETATLTTEKGKKAVRPIKNLMVFKN